MSDLASYRMSAGTRQVLASLVPVICPTEWSERCTLDDLLNEMELGLRSMPPLVRRGLIVALTFYDASAVLRHGARARSLPPDRAALWFEGWRHGLPLQRDIAKGVRALIAMAYYEMPGVLRAMGYTPREWIAMVTARRLASYRDDIDRHEKSLFERDPVPLPSEVLARLGPPS